jgi:hypothetical protein
MKHNTDAVTLNLDPEWVQRLAKAVAYWDDHDIDDDQREYEYHTDDLIDFAREVLSHFTHYRSEN